MENEVNTYPIIEKAWEEGKKVVVLSVIKEQERCPSGKLIILIN